ncbi:MAG: 2-oxo acid dehydrogenase subunit E2, partial [Microthrixaceae bacterium]
QTAVRLGIDLGGVQPAHPDSPIDRADVERHVRERLADAPTTEVRAARAPAGHGEAPLLQEPTQRIPLTGMRGRIADRMHASLSEMAQLTLTMDASMDAVVAHRSTFEGATRPGYTDYVIAAAARALREHPVINSQIADGAVNLLGEINVGVAVALDGGLVVPVLHRADQLDFEELCSRTTGLAAAARGGALAMADIEGGTFSVTALGMYGVDAFTPVINPPNTAILGVGRLRDDIRWVDDNPIRSKTLTLSLTWDHRAYDGAPAAEFTAAVRDHLERWPST